MNPTTFQRDMYRIMNILEAEGMERVSTEPFEYKGREYILEVNETEESKRRNPREKTSFGEFSG